MWRMYCFQIEPAIAAIDTKTRLAFLYCHDTLQMSFSCIFTPMTSCTIEGETPLISNAIKISLCNFTVRTGVSTLITTHYLFPAMSMSERQWVPDWQLLLQLLPCAPTRNRSRYPDWMHRQHQSLLTSLQETDNLSWRTIRHNEWFLRLQKRMSDYLPAPNGTIPVSLLFLLNLLIFSKYWNFCQACALVIRTTQSPKSCFVASCASNRIKRKLTRIYGDNFGESGYM